MSERDLRRRVTAYRRAHNHSRGSRPSPLPLPARRRIRTVGGRKLWRPSESVRVLKRSKSEPSLWKAGGVFAVAIAEEEEDEGGVLYRPGTCTDILSSPDNSVDQSLANVSGRYNKDAKIVINVTVEGSPGPIRTLVKLGSNIEDITKLVIKKYNEEGRTPRLDKDAASTCELHHSYFSLQSLSKSDLIADVGSRSFYLRRCSSRSYLSDDSKTDVTSASSNQMEIVPLPFLPSFMNRKIKKIFRRTRKVWKILGCMPCAG